MAIQLVCPQCRAGWVFEDRHQGHPATCAKCGTTFVIPVSPRAGAGLHAEGEDEDGLSPQTMLVAGIGGGTLVLTLVALLFITSAPAPTLPLAQATPAATTPIATPAESPAAPAAGVPPAPPPSVSPQTQPPPAASLPAPSETPTAPFSAPGAVVPPAPPVPAPVPRLDMRQPAGPPPAVAAPRKIPVQRDDWPGEPTVSRERLAQLDPELAAMLTQFPKPQWSLVANWPSDRAIMAVAVSADGRRIVNVTDNARFRCWEVATGKLVSELENPPRGINPRVSLSADGKRCAVANEGAPVQVWNTDTGKLLMAHDAAKGKPILFVRISDDGEWVVFITRDRTLCRFPALGGQGIVAPSKHPDPEAVFAGSNSQADLSFFGVPEEETFTYAWPSKDSTAQITPPFQYSVAGDVSENRIALATELHRAIQLELSPNSGVQSSSIQHVQQPRYLKHSPDGRWLWICGNQGEVEIRNCETPGVPCTTQVPIESTPSYAAAPGERLLVCAHLQSGPDSPGSTVIWRLSAEPAPVTSRCLLGVRKLLTEKRYERLDDFGRQLRAESEELFEHWRHLVSHEIQITGDQPDARVKAWLNERPDSTLARLATASAHIQHAWDARGSGRADTVTEEGWKAFHLNIDRAQALLAPGFRGDERLPREAYLKLISVAMAQGWDRKKMEPFVTRMVRDYPTYVDGHVAVCTRWLVRWGGQPQDSNDYAVAAAQHVGGPQGESLYAQIGLRMASYCRNAGNFEQETGFDLARIGKGLTALEGTPQQNLTTLSRGLLVFRAHKMKNEARLCAQALESLLPHWDAVIWQNKRHYLRVLEESLQK